MKLIAFGNRSFRQISNLSTCFLLLLLCNACATFHEQYGSNAAENFIDSLSQEKPVHTFYLVGDAGNSDKEKAKYGLSFLKSRLDKANRESTLLFLGDNIYPNGMAAEGKQDRAQSEEKLDNQIALSDKFKGKTIFIPGNHDWYNGGLKGLGREEKYIDGKLGKKSFLPKDGCGIEDLKISDDISLVIIDSQWYMENWDENPTINDNCDIKSRDAFFAELDELLNKNQNKTTILALHHPLVSNGIHGGQYSLEKSLFPFQQNIPLPIIGTAINFVRKTSGLDPQDIQNKKYSELVRRIKTMIQGRENVIVVSGHEHNLEYVEKYDIKQIVSGAGSKSEAARAMRPNDFSYGGNGYAVLEIFGKGESRVSFYGIKGQKEQLLYSIQVTPPKAENAASNYPNSFPQTQSASVYEESRLHKSGFYNFIWGKHYRAYYGKKIRVETIDLDTLYGGLKPILAGGGHQSLSLRLEDAKGRSYVMRGLKKSATRFLQAVAFKDKSVDFKDTYIEDFLLDFYTTSHPYTPFVTGDLAESLGISHSNPKLYYVPKQNALGEFNQDYGDALYMIEQRPAKGFENFEDFGRPDAIVSTDDVLQNLHKDEKYAIDEKAYIRARLFDMLIGDWDRHSDQWRWGQYSENGKIIYRPIPRDHDQAFCKYDGVLLSLVLKMPSMRHMQSFKKDIANVKWFNREPYPLDLALIRNADANDWEEQAAFIKSNLTDQKIEAAFAKLPEEVHDATVEEIIRNLQSRREKLSDYAARYHRVLQQTAIVVGTDKKDKFQIERLPGGKTRIKTYRPKKDGETLVSEQVYDRKNTREIWIYGLDDDDLYEVSGQGNKLIKIRLIGGFNNDTYNVAKAGKVRIYDFESKANTFALAPGVRKILTDNYALNQYDYQKPKYNAFSGFPSAGYNPDDGLKIGAMVFYTVNGFQRNPFSQRHTVKANYYFATSGYELAYKGVFPNSRNNWQFQADAKITSPNFSYNFFGYGNQTDDYDFLDKDYNRVKTQVLSISPSMSWKGQLGAFFSGQVLFESVEVDRTPNRFIGTGVVPDRVFDTQNFAGLGAKYGFENYDVPANPTLGMKFSLEADYKINIGDLKRQVPQLEAELGFSHRILTTEKLVFATLFRTKMLLSNDFEFYQMATIGGEDDLRGYRKERFSGKRSFIQTSDLRYEIGKFKNGVLPLNYGVLAGFDYGRVWLDGENSGKWHKSFGGGIWFSGIETLTAKLSYFISPDGGRLAIGFGFGF